MIHFPSEDLLLLLMKFFKRLMFTAFVQSPPSEDASICWSCVLFDKFDKSLNRIDIELFRIRWRVWVISKSFQIIKIKYTDKKESAPFVKIVLITFLSEFQMSCFPRWFLTVGANFPNHLWKYSNQSERSWKYCSLLLPCLDSNKEEFSLNI